MGLDVESVRFLLQAKKRGARFERIVTLGRQLFVLSKTEIQRLLVEYGLSPSDHGGLLDQEYPSFADSFWPILGATRADVLDASDYEGANVIHNLNEPMPEEWFGKYDAVCDVGTLEHVFHFPQALQSSLQLLKTGGTFFAFTTANNYFGHGFYQFSPELFFRVLGEENGFHMNRCIAVEYGPRPRWFDIADPEASRSRVTLINRHPVLLFVDATRIADKPILVRAPQQSDYVSMWESKLAASKSTSSFAAKLKSILLDQAPGFTRSLERTYVNYFARAHAFRNRSSFSKSSKSLD